MSNWAREYCYEKAARPDSPTYYSLRYLNSAERDVVVAVHAFYREIEGVVFECQDHDLAIAKFNWWRSEVAKISSDKPDHPVTLFLQATLSTGESALEKLFSIIDAIQHDSIPASFATFEDVVIHFMRTAGMRELLINDELKTDKTISSEIIYQLMLVVELVDYIQHLRRYLRRDFIYFPSDELLKFHLTPADLCELKTTPTIKNLLHYQAEKVERAYKEACDSLTRHQREQLSQLLIRCEIARATLRAIQASDYCVLENLIRLTPLRFWWIAWRA
ncbi:MAG: squalene/phytoene synthase family protein [Gammaproteobacteria bacterium]